MGGKTRRAAETLPWPAPASELFPPAAVDPWPARRGHGSDDDGLTANEMATPGRSGMTTHLDGIALRFAVAGQDQSLVTARCLALQA